RSYGCEAMRGGCGNVHVRADWLESFVVGALLKVADDPALRATVRNATAKTEARDVLAEIGVLEERRRQFARDRAEGWDDDLWKIADESVRAKLRELHREVETANAD